MQTEVMNLLRKSKKPLGRTEIAKALKEDNLPKVSSCLKRLLKSNEIKCIEISRERALDEYNSKRRMRLYYI